MHLAGRSQTGEAGASQKRENREKNSRISEEVGLEEAGRERESRGRGVCEREVVD